MILPKCLVELYILLYPPLTIPRGWVKRLSGLLYAGFTISVTLLSWLASWNTATIDSLAGMSTNIHWQWQGSTQWLKRPFIVFQPQAKASAIPRNLYKTRNNFLSFHSYYNFTNGHTWCFKQFFLVWQRRPLGIVLQT